MIDQPTENVKLTLDQLKQLEVVETRLGNLQTEIKLATKNLSALTNDTNRITKEKEYQEGLLVTVSTQVIEGQNKVNTLNEQILVLQDTLAKTASEISTKRAEFTKKEVSMNEREDSLLAKENDYAERKATLSKEEEDFIEKEEVFNTKVEKLRELIETF